MAGYDGRKDLVLYASNYIVYEYPTIRETRSCAYSDNGLQRQCKSHKERVLASTYNLGTPPNHKASRLATCLNPHKVQAVTI